jgi:hypothetical protein
MYMNILLSVYMYICMYMNILLSVYMYICMYMHMLHRVCMYMNILDTFSHAHEDVLRKDEYIRIARDTHTHGSC